MITAAGLGDSLRREDERSEERVVEESVDHGDATLAGEPDAVVRHFLAVGGAALREAAVDGVETLSLPGIDRGKASPPGFGVSMSVG